MERPAIEVLKELVAGYRFPDLDHLTESEFRMLVARAIVEVAGGLEMIAQEAGRDIAELKNES